MKPDEGLEEFEEVSAELKRKEEPVKGGNGHYLTLSTEYSPWHFSNFQNL